MGWKSGVCICIIILLLCIVPCQAGMSSDIFYKFLNGSKTITSAYDILYVESGYTLNSTVQSHKHLRGLVDIVGFSQMVCIDGKYYIPGAPEDHTIIKTKLWADGLGFNDYIDSITVTDERITTAGNNTTVEIDIRLLWHHSERRSRTINGKSRPYISKTYYREYVTFTASRPAPQTYPNTTIPELNVIVYNDSIKPKTIIHLPDTKYIIGYSIEFKNESIEYFNSVLLVEKQDNGVPFGNITKVASQSIYEDSDLFSRAGSNIIINSTEIDDSLRIYAITPFDELEINYTITNCSDQQMLDNVQMSSAFSLLMLAWMIVFLLKYYRK